MTIEDIPDKVDRLIDANNLPLTLSQKILLQATMLNLAMECFYGGQASFRDWRADGWTADLEKQ